MGLPVLSLQVLRTLELEKTDGKCYFSAASGMWVENDTLFVVADDELELGVFALHSQQPGQTLTIIPEQLPDDLKQRKQQKPDFESLTRLPASSRYPHGALIALGSGSTQQRKQGMLWPFLAAGKLAAAPQLFPLQALYGPLEEKFADLNIEGLTIQGDCFKLWQRGNNLNLRSAVAEYRLDDLYGLLDAQAGVADMLPQHIEHYDLGLAGGVPLTFTDAFALEDGRCLFTAVAENTDDSYRDGECVGAAIGLIDENRQLQGIWSVEPVHKIEGISVQKVADGRLQVLLVTDADDPQVPALLLETWLPM